MANGGVGSLAYPVRKKIKTKIKRAVRKNMNIAIMDHNRREAIRQVVRTAKRRVKIALVVLPFVLLAVYWGLYAVNEFFSKNELKFQNPIQSPILIQTRVTQSAQKPSEIYEALAAIRKPEYENQIDQKIFETFSQDGDVERGHLSVAVSRAENGTRACDRYAQNKGSADIGLFQINTVHLNKYPLSQLVDCDGNIQAAFEIYSASKGFYPWVAYKNGSYKKFLIN